MERETISYRGINYIRYPQAKTWPERMYFLCSPGSVRDNRRLHRQKWIDRHGPIPEGYEIHHKNGNALDNQLANLECLSIEQHKIKHPLSPSQIERRKQQLDQCRHLAAQWHRSEAGRQWHKNHAQKMHFGKGQTIEYVCLQCGERCTSCQTNKQAKFCSRKCKAAYRRSTGIDDEQRVCVICKTTFIINKYSRTQTCSRSCAGYLRWKKTASI